MATVKFDAYLLSDGFNTNNGNELNDSGLLLGASSIISKVGFTGGLPTLVFEVAADGSTFSTKFSTLTGDSDRWDIGYNHSQLTSGNPHSLNYTDVGAAPLSHTHTESDITDLKDYYLASNPNGYIGSTNVAFTNVTNVFSESQTIKGDDATLNFLAAGHDVGTLGLEFAHYYSTPTRIKTGIISDSTGSWGRADLHFLANLVSDNSKFVLGDDTRIFIDGTTGNVGVGTIAPLEVLEITDKVQTDTFLKISSSTFGRESGIKLRQGGTFGFDIYNDDSTAGGNKGLNIDYVSNGVRGNAMFIDPAGKVGIGTTNPSQALDVVGNGVFSGKVGVGTYAPESLLDVYGDNPVLRVRQNSNIAGNPQIHLSAAGSNNSSSVRLQNAYIYSKTNYASALYIGKDLSSTPSIFVETSINRVGINNSNPQEALDVIGNGKFSGGVTALTSIVKNQYGRITSLFTSDIDGNSTTIMRGGNYTHGLFLEDGYKGNGTDYTRYFAVTGGYTSDAIITLKKYNADGTASNISTYSATGANIGGIISVIGGNSTNWNTAYGWGNHATAGYLTSYTDTNYYLSSLSQNATNCILGVTGATNITIPAATETLAGLVDNTAQTFGGVKSFADYIQLKSGTTTWSLEPSSTKLTIKVGGVEKFNISNVGDGTFAGRVVTTEGVLSSGDIKGANTITNEEDSYTSTPKATQIVTLTQVEYDAIVTSDVNTMYIIL